MRGENRPTDAIEVMYDWFLMRISSDGDTLDILKAKVSSLFLSICKTNLLL